MASRLLENPSIVEWFSEHEGYRCGYCKQEDSNYSHGLWAHTLTVQDYQDLIDRGWRRSGKYCYKPTMNRTCCPHYTIRCDAPQFKLSKSNKKVIKRVNRFLIHGTKPRDKDDGMEADSESKNDPTSRTGTTSSSTETGSATVGRKVPQKGAGPDPDRPPCKQAKELRRERKLQKQAANPSSSKQTDHTAQNSGEPKTLEDFLAEPMTAENPAHKLEIKLVRSTPRSPDFTQAFDETHKVYQSYQTTIHKDPPDKPSRKQFTRFLVDSPLQPKTSAVLKDGYGSFHQHYVLDGRLIAVGVVDILPSCVSSVYLFYHPDYDFLSLGTYTALQELAFTRSLHKLEPQLNFYYMGYYIHSCPKMKYKGQYHPSFLLCPEAYTWQPIENCRPKLDRSNYSRLDDDKNKRDTEGDVDENKTLVLHEGEAMTYKQYARVSRQPDDREDVRQFSSFVGKRCAERMLLFRQ